MSKIAAGEHRRESDVDVLVVSEALGYRDLSRAVQDVQQRLGREVNIMLYRPDEFVQKINTGHHFLTRVISGPKVFLIGSEDELTRMGAQRLAAAAPAQSGRDR